MRMRELVGRNIGRLRLDRGLSQEALADKAKIERAHLGRIENGQVNVTVDLLDKVAKTLRVRPVDLFEPPLLGRAPPKPLKKGPKSSRR